MERKHGGQKSWKKAWKSCAQTSSAWISRKSHFHVRNSGQVLSVSQWVLFTLFNLLFTFRSWQWWSGWVIISWAKEWTFLKYWFSKARPHLSTHTSGRELRFSFYCLPLSYFVLFLLLSSKRNNHQWPISGWGLGLMFLKEMITTSSCLPAKGNTPIYVQFTKNKSFQYMLLYKSQFHY